jgi:hypothetical protein
VGLSRVLEEFIQWFVSRTWERTLWQRRGPDGALLRGDTGTLFST